VRSFEMKSYHFMYVLAALGNSPFMTQLIVTCFALNKAYHVLQVLLCVLHLK